MFIYNFFKSGLEWLGFFKKDASIIFLGLDNAGKTTMLNLLQTGKFQQLDSTIHPHMAEVTIGKINFKSYDLGGHSAARRTWTTYLETVDGIVFMIDAADLDRMAEARKILHDTLSLPNVKEKPMLIFGNKADLKTALKEENLRDDLGLPWHSTKGKDAANKNPNFEHNAEVFMCSVKAKVGFSEGFDWLSQ